MEVIPAVPFKIKINSSYQVRNINCCLKTKRLITPEISAWVGEGEYELMAGGTCGSAEGEIRTY